MLAPIYGYAIVDVSFDSKGVSMPRKKRKLERLPGDLHTIESFCLANRISEAMYYKLKRQHKGPREMKVGKRTLITPEAEADWRRAREQDY